MCVIIFLVKVTEWPPIGKIAAHVSWYKYLDPVVQSIVSLTISLRHKFVNAALTYTEYPLRMLNFENRAEITEYDANGRGGACRKRCIRENVKNARRSLQMF